MERWGREQEDGRGGGRPRRARQISRDQGGRRPGTGRGEAREGWAPGEELREGVELRMGVVSGLAAGEGRGL